MSLSAAAAAALAVAVPTPQPERLAWVDVESPPKMVGMIDPATGETSGQYAEVDADLGLTDKMADKFRAVCDVVDDNGCEATGCQSGPGYNRPDGTPMPAGIGWCLAGEADERVEWAPVTLVQRKRKVIAVCLDCSPATIYEGLWAKDDDEE